MRGVSFLAAQTGRQTWCIIIIAMNLDKNDYDSNFEDAVVVEAATVSAKRL